jgi:sugar lactone lactonase YvrE
LGHSVASISWFTARHVLTARGLLSSVPEHATYVATLGGRTNPTRKTYGGLFHATHAGSKIACARDRLLSPNGVGLLPDEKTVYVADGLTGRLWECDVAAPGELVWSRLRAHRR